VRSRTPSPNRPEEVNTAISDQSNVEEMKSNSSSHVKKLKKDFENDDHKEFPEELPIQMVCGDETSESVKNVLKDIPEDQHAQANKLIAFLCSTKIFRWTVNGEVSLKGKIYPKTNISDLISAVTSSTNRLQKLNIPGLESFSRFLKFVNAPTELLGSAFLKIHASENKTGGTSDETTTRLDRQDYNVGKGIEPCIRWISFEDWKSKQ
jgi:hypothetical protein